MPRHRARKRAKWLDMRNDEPHVVLPVDYTPGSIDAGKTYSCSRNVDGHDGDAVADRDRRRETMGDRRREMKIEEENR